MRKTTRSKNIKKRGKKFSFLFKSSFLAIGILVLFYVIQISNLAKEISLLSQKQVLAKELSAQINEIEPKIFSSQPLKLGEIAKNFNFEKIDKIHFINVQSLSVAAK